MQEYKKYIAKTFQGLESTLENELKDIGVTEIKILRRAVSFVADKEQLYKANYLLRTCLNILEVISVFKISNAEDLYIRTKRISWDRYFSSQNTFMVKSVLFSENFTHSGFVALKVKDAIADSFREKFGKRPSVDTQNPDIIINVHIAADLCTISMDTTGIPLYKRGYRTATGPAPLNEVLAAGIILLSGYKPTDVLIDPMCGSGTIAIEAAMISLNIPAGRYRDSFSLENLPDFDKKLWDKVLFEAEDAIITGQPLSIQASDIDRYMIEKTKENIRNAGLSSHIEIFTQDFFEFPKQESEIFLIMNPPYDIRLKTENINLLYSNIGTKLKHDFSGGKACIFTGNDKAAKNVGLKPSKKTELYNASVKSALLCYELYSGSKKIKKTF